MTRIATWMLLMVMGAATAGCNANVGKALMAAAFISVTAVRTAAVLCDVEEVDCSGGPATEPVFTGGYQEPYSAAVDW